MVLDRYGHLFEGARGQATLTMDRVFAKATIGRQTAGCRPKENADPKKAFEISVRRGGGEETRTPDPLHAKQFRQENRETQEASQFEEKAIAARLLPGFEFPGVSAVVRPFPRNWSSNGRQKAGR